MKIIAASTNRKISSTIDILDPKVQVILILEDFTYLSCIMYTKQAFNLNHNYNIPVKVCKNEISLKNFIQTLKG